jgi:hypothetical protein
MAPPVLQPSMVEPCLCEAHLVYPARGEPLCCRAHYQSQQQAYEQRIEQLRRTAKATALRFQGQGGCNVSAPSLARRI